MPPAHLFSDARSSPPRVAAVLFCDGVCSYTDVEPPKQLMDSWDESGDKHIMSLEILSIALGMYSSFHPQSMCEHLRQCAGICSFKSQLRMRDLVIWSDNTGAENAVSKGEGNRKFMCNFLFSANDAFYASATKRFDHNALIHQMWSTFIAIKAQVWVMRVPTKDNVADDPSR